MKARTVHRLTTHPGSTNGTDGRRRGTGTPRGASGGSAQRPFMRMPRPMSEPRERQSIQPIVCGHRDPASFRPSMKRSMSWMRSVSVSTHGDGTRTRRHSTSRMWPVSPIPPIVARNRSGSCAGEHSRMRLSATRMRSRRTWAPKHPSRWWFLPWTSVATMPPSVIICVPGVTGA